MRIQCLQENLQKGLVIVSKAVPAKPTLPILSNLLIQTEGQKLKVSATNLRLSISCWLDAIVEESGKMCILAHLINEVVSSLPASRVDIDGQGSLLHLKCNKANTKLNTMPPEGYPIIPTIEGEAMIIGPQQLKQAIDVTQFAAATEQSRPILTGASFTVQDGKLTLATADGYRLSVYKGLINTPDKAFTVIIPVDTLSEVAKLIGNQEEPVKVTLGSNLSQILFKLTGVEIVGQLLAGEFPQYEALIPTTHLCSATFDASEMLAAIRVAAVFAKGSNDAVKLVSGAQCLQISARSESIGEYADEVQAAIEGETLKVALSSKYLIDFLSSAGKSQVIMKTTSPSNPVLFESSNIRDYKHVIMPLYVQWD